MDQQKDIGLVGHLVKACEAPAPAAEEKPDPATMLQGAYDIAFIYTCADPACGHTQAITDPKLVMTAIQQSAGFVMRCQKCGAQQALKPSWAQAEQSRIVTPHGKLERNVLERFKRAMKG